MQSFITHGQHWMIVVVVVVVCIWEHKCQSCRHHRFQSWQHHLVSIVDCLWYSLRSSSGNTRFAYFWVRLPSIWGMLSFASTSFPYSFYWHCYCRRHYRKTFPEPDWETKVLPCFTFREHILHNLVSESMVRAYFYWLQLIYFTNCMFSSIQLTTLSLYVALSSNSFYLKSIVEELKKN